MDNDNGIRVHDPPPPEILPWYLELSVRFGVSPRDWSDALGCHEKIYLEKTNAVGPVKARYWAVKTSAYLWVIGITRIFLGGF